MFSRRWIINYLLIFLIILFTYIGNRFDVKTGFQPERRVSQLDPADIVTIDIRTASSSTTLIRDQRGWTITAPIVWPAEDSNVERLLSIVNSETDSRLPAGEIDAANLGLDFPRARLRLNDTPVTFGATNNIGERRYTRIGDTVFLLPDVHLPFVSQGVLGMLDRRLLPPEFELSRLRLPGLDIERGDGGAWRAPGGDADGAQLEQLIANWQGLSSTRVQDYDASGTPRQKIEAQLADGQRLEFYLMSIEPEIVIANPRIGIQYHFRAELYYQMLALKHDASAGWPESCALAVQTLDKGDCDHRPG